MLPIKLALQDFPSETLRDQFDKVFSAPSCIPTSPKTQALRTRYEEFNAKISNMSESQAERD